MGTALRRGIKAAAAYAGLFGLSRMLTRKNLRIVVYHRFQQAGGAEEAPISADQFEEHILYLKAHYSIYRLAELAGRLKSSRPFSRPAAVITVDDGHSCFYRHAYPVLKKHSVPATLFVTPKLVGMNGWLWFDKLEYLRCLAPGLPEFAEDRLEALLLDMKHKVVAECEEQLANLALGAGVSIPEKPPSQYALSTWEELGEMADSGLVDIGAHTMSHQILGAVGPEEAWRELSLCRDNIMEWLGFSPETFCYPNGLDGDYGPEHLEMASRAGYLCAVASRLGLAGESSHLFALPRIHGSRDYLQFRKRVDGVEHLQRRISGTA